MKNTITAHSHFPRKLWSSYEYPIQYQSENSQVHQMVIEVPPIMLTIQPRMVDKV